MDVEFALQEVLHRYGLRKRGVVPALATRLKVKRGAIYKLLSGETTGFTCDRLAEICAWLVEQVDDPVANLKLRRELPGALFRFSGLWGRLLANNLLTLCIGERYANRSRMGVQRSERWISGADAGVATDIVHKLTGGGAQFSVKWKPAAFHLFSDEEGPVVHLDPKDIQAAGKIANEALEPYTTKMVIGSQKVNPVLEWEWARYSGDPVKPFSDNDHPALYVQYREQDESQPKSCFGGVLPPPGTTIDAPGVHYLDEERRWCHAPWRENERCVGVVLVAEDSVELGSLTVLLFGFSGTCTELTGKLLLSSPERFWPPNDTALGRRMGVYICSFGPSGVQGATVTKVGVRLNEAAQ